MIVPVRLRFPFELQFIPKKGRNDRTGSFFGDGYGMVRRAEPAEVCPAFRLHFPRMPRRRAFKVELIWLDGRLWWPLQGYNFLPFDSTLSADDFIEKLAIGDDIFGVNRSLIDTMEMPLMRAVLSSNYDEVLATVQRKLSENILLCGDVAYAAGGEPVYVQTRFRSPWETRVVSTGLDRSVDPSIRDLRESPGDYTELKVQEAFQYGRFQLANERQFAEKQTASRSIPIRTMPRIEILMPELPRISRDQIRLDALFRCAMDPRSDWLPWNLSDGDSKTFEICRSHMETVAAQDPAAPTTTQDRFDALDQFIACADGGDSLRRMSVDFRRLRRNFKSLAASETLTGLWSEARHVTEIPDEWLSGLS